MKSSTTFEQAFYGNDHSGYHILGNSDPKYSTVIEEICSAIGTPDGFSEVSPFLISTICGDMLIVICGRMGTLDSSNRKTLFFHALYAPQNICEQHGINAFRLFRAGIFVDCPTSDCKQITIDFELDTEHTYSSPFDWDGEKLALVCNSPANNLMEVLLGNKVNHISWASFTFAPLKGFIIYAISENVTLPDDRLCRNQRGKVLFRPQKTVNEQSISSKEQYSNTTPHEQKGHIPLFMCILLFISLALNILFIVKPGLLLHSAALQNGEGSSSPQQSSMNVTSNNSLLQLRESFPNEKIINLDKEKEFIGNGIFFERADDTNADENSFFRRLKYYVDFVNQNILFNSKEISK